MMGPPDDDVLWTRALRHSHQGSPALLGVSFAVRQDEILGVLGPHGAGKSTLLRCLSGQLLPDEGEVWFNSAPVHTLTVSARTRLRREHFGWIGDSPDLLPELTARENAALPLLLRGVPRRTAKKTAQDWLDRLEIGSLALSRPSRLLQSQRQRVAVARALVTNPDVIFADEPTAPLHRADRLQVLRILTTAARSHGITLVLATDDPEVAALTDRTVTLVDGRLDATPPLPLGEDPAPCSASA